MATTEIDAAVTQHVENINITDTNNGAGTEASEDEGRFGVAEGADDTAPKFPRFFELPREVRDRVYEFALVPVLPDVPIDFAPLVPGQHYDDFWENYGPDERGNFWHYVRYNAEIKPALRMLRTSKQINKEAAPIYYSQPFRFTNQAGWLALYHWLEQIGVSNAALVKDITVCHPAWSSLPEHFYEATCTHSEITNCFGMRSLYEQEEFYGNGPVTGPLVDVVETLRRMRSLQRLHLILHTSSAPELWSRSPSHHAIHTLDPVEFPNLRTHVIHLVSYRAEYRRIHYEMTLAELGILNEDFQNDPLWSERVSDNGFWGSYRTEGREGFHALKEQGVEVVELLYDQHRHYPVIADEECVNKDLCEYIWLNTCNYSEGPDHPNVCPGTKSMMQTYGISA